MYLVKMGDHSFSATVLGEEDINNFTEINTMFTNGAILSQNVSGPLGLHIGTTGTASDVNSSHHHELFDTISTLLTTNGNITTSSASHTALTSCFMFSAGVVGNLLALFVLATSGVDQRRTLFYKLVAGLAVTDLLGTCATSPVVIAVYLNGRKWVGGIAMCDYFSFAMIFAGCASMLIVCVMSVERYICVRHPYIYHTRLSGKFGRLTLLVCWAVSIAIASLPLLGVGKNIIQASQTWCFFDYVSTRPSDIAFNYIYALFALAAVVITSVCNFSVIVTLVTLRSRRNSLDASEAPRRRRYRLTSQRFAEVQMMIMLIGITVIFTACFAPLMIYVLLCQTDLARAFNNSTILLLIRLASFNPILDPWVYILFRRELAWKLVRLWRCVFRLPPLSRPQNLIGLQKEPTKTYRNGEANSSMMMANGRKQNLEDGADASCVMFCYQCLCLPPVPRASVVLSQTRGNSGRTCQGAISSGRQTRREKPEPSPDHLHSFRSTSKCSTHLFQKSRSFSEQSRFSKPLADLSDSSRSVESNI